MLLEIRSSHNSVLSDGSFNGWNIGWYQWFPGYWMCHQKTCFNPKWISDSKAWRFIRSLYFIYCNDINESKINSTRPPGNSRVLKWYCQIFQWMMRKMRILVTQRWNKNSAIEINSSKSSPSSHSIKSSINFDSKFFKNNSKDKPNWYYKIVFCW